MALLYDPNARANKNGFLFSAGDPSLRFGACPEADVAYPGGFIAKHPIRVMLHVQSKKSSLSGSILLWCERLLSQLKGKPAQPLGRSGCPRLHGEPTVKDSRRVSDGDPKDEVQHNPSLCPVPASRSRPSEDEPCTHWPWDNDQHLAQLHRTLWR